MKNKYADGFLVAFGVLLASAILFMMFDVHGRVQGTGHHPTAGAVVAYGLSFILIAIPVAGGLALYFLPVIIAYFRQAQRLNAIGFITLFLGWTVLAWIAMVIWAAVDEPQTAGLVTRVPVAGSGQ